MKSKNLSGTSVNFRMTERDRQTIDNLAQAGGVSRSDALRALVRAAEQKRLIIDFIPQQQVAQHVQQK